MEATTSVLLVVGFPPVAGPIVRRDNVDDIAGVMAPRQVDPSYVAGVPSRSATGGLKSRHSSSGL